MIDYNLTYKENRLIRSKMSIQKVMLFSKLVNIFGNYTMM